VTQLSQGVFSGGTWNIADKATLGISGSASNITTNQASVTLGRPGAHFANLNSITTNAGTLDLEGGASFKTAGDLSSSGTLIVGPASTLTVAGKYTQTATGDFTTEIAGEPASGLFGVLASTGAATLGGTLTISLVQGFGPRAGGNFVVMTYPSETGDFATVNRVAAGRSQLFVEATSPTEVLVTSTQDASDLAVTASDVNAQSSGTPGQPVTVTYTVHNLSTATTSVPAWTDSVYVSLSDTLDSSAVLLGRVTHTGAVEGVGSAMNFYTGSLTTSLPGLAPGQYRIFVEVDSRHFVPDPNRDNNLAAGTTLLKVGFPALGLGAPTATTIDYNQDLYYQVNLPGGSATLIAASFAGVAGGQLFVAYGHVPSSTSYDEAATDLAQSTQQILLPGTQAGTYYILVHGSYGSSGGKNLTLSVQSLPLKVVSISPNQGGNDGTVTVAVEGSQFTVGAAVSLVPASGSPLGATSVTFQNSSTLYATFNLTGQPAGTYTIQVAEGTQTATLASGFTITPGVRGQVISSITTPSIVRVGQSGTVTISFENTGDTDAPAPLFVLTARTRSGIGIPMSVPGVLTAGSTVQFLGLNPQGEAGVLPPHFKGTIAVRFTVPGNVIGHDQITFNLGEVGGDNQPIDWNAEKAALQPSFINATAWDAVFPTFVAAVGSTNQSLQDTLDADATYLGFLGAPTPDVARLVAYEIAKADDALLPLSIASSVDASFPMPGSLSFSLSREFLQSISGRDTMGRFGLGWADNWDDTLSVDGQGNVTIRQGPTFRFFARSPDGSFTPGTGDFATLTLTQGAYQLRETDGTTLDFNSDGSLKDEADPNGNTITCGYTGGRLTSLTASSGAAITLGYNAQGLVSQVSDPAGRVTTYSYDAAGHLLTYTNKFGQTQYSYLSGPTAAEMNALSSIAYSDNTHLTFSYDAQGRVVGQARDGGADALTLAYLSAGGYTITDADGNTETYLLNNMGQVGEYIDGLGRVTQAIYGSNAELQKTIAPDVSTYTFAYDPHGNVTTVTDPLGGKVSYTYSPKISRLLSYQDQRGNTTRFSIDASGNETGVTYPDGASESYQYSSQGLLTAYTNALGQQTTFTYDKNGQMTGELLPGGASTTFQYAAAGNLIMASGPGGTSTYTYGPLGLPTQIVTPYGTLSTTYNSVGQETQTTQTLTGQPSFTVNYGYDRVGRLITLTDAGNNPIVNYSFDRAGFLTGQSMANGTSTTYQYDAAGEILQVVNKAPGGAVNSSFAYTYNPNGLVSGVTSGGVTTSYTYDADGRLLSAASPGQQVQYVYDPAGNRVSSSINGVVTSYTVNNRNEYTAIGAASYTYDPDGNLTSAVTAGGTTTYTFDALNRLVGVSTPTDTISYLLDPFGEVTATTDNGQTTNNLIAPTALGSVVAQASSSGQVIANYTYGFGLVSRVDSTASAAFYDYDAEGNTVGLTSASGALVNTYSYSPSGAVTATGAVSNPFTYVGRYGVSTDQSGLFDMRARWYNPATGQFLSQDPTGIAGGNPNLRTYAGNDPVNSIDPAGLRNYRFDNTTQNLGNPVPNPPGGLENDGDRITQTYDPNTGQTSAQYPPLDVYARPLPGYSLYDGNGVPTDPWVTIDLHDGNGGQWYSLDPAALHPAGDPGGQGGGDSGGGAGGSCDCTPDNGPPDEPPPPPLPPPGGSGDTDPRTPGDPNNLIGPAGYGAAGFVGPGQTFPYSILFQNMPTASAPAQVVVVTQQLDPNFDWTTFQLGSFGFGNYMVNVPAGQTSYSARIDARATVGLFVDASAALNLKTGLLTVTFTSIDPATLDVTADPLAGFLPTDTSPPQGDGFVSYTVKPRGVRHHRNRDQRTGHRGLRPERAGEHGHGHQHDRRRCAHQHGQPVIGQHVHDDVHGEPVRDRSGQWLGYRQLRPVYFRQRWAVHPGAGRHSGNGRRGRDLHRNRELQRRAQPHLRLLECGHRQRRQRPGDTQLGAADHSGHHRDAASHQYLRGLGDRSLRWQRHPDGDPDRRRRAAGGKERRLQPDDRGKHRDCRTGDDGFERSSDAPGSQPFRAGTGHRHRCDRGQLRRRLE
jgi:RHS repeat-associated protein